MAELLSSLLEYCSECGLGGQASPEPVTVEGILLPEREPPDALNATPFNPLIGYWC